MELALLDPKRMSRIVFKTFEDALMRRWKRILENSVLYESEGISDSSEDDDNNEDIYSVSSGERFSESLSEDEMELEEPVSKKARRNEWNWTRISNTVKEFNFTATPGYCMQFSVKLLVKNRKGTKDIPSSEAVVLELMKPYLHMGYAVAMDNWYSSPDLFKKLAKEKTNVLGTLTVNRKNMPKAFKTRKKGYRKLFFYVMDMVVYNMYVLYKKISGKRIQSDDFREDLAEKFLEGVELPEYIRRGRPASGLSPMLFQAAN
ncbi:hypothetical protein J437_LFUL005297 [Ladona fulva]|uniref:PiggyBac transposable element-derived protein domain-containing protein n=1 Tax=Ladona fulva TaxID=123851 RepID=A0A8K0K1N4_LADFU|nr:hypothetical protein J437_LFUL005297 [Ladona fulva]